MSGICEITGLRPIKGNHIWRSGKAKKKGGIGTHVTGITKRRFLPNLQRVKAVVDGEVRYIRVAVKALKRGLVTKAPLRTWKKGDPAKVAKVIKPTSVAKPSAKVPTAAVAPKAPVKAPVSAAPSKPAKK